MFVKIEIEYMDSVYDCEAVHFRHAADSEGPGSVFVDMDMKGGKESTTVEISKAGGNAVYLMNEDGRTIDHFQWSERQTRVVNAVAR